MQEIVPWVQNTRCLVSEQPVGSRVPTSWCHVDRISRQAAKMLRNPILKTFPVNDVFHFTKPRLIWISQLLGVIFENFQNKSKLCTKYRVLWLNLRFQ